jgi:hypothetical protein
MMPATSVSRAHDMTLAETVPDRAVIGRAVNGQPSTYREVWASIGREAGYRRLAITILGLDIASLARDLRSARQAASGSQGTCEPGLATTL